MVSKPTYIDLFAGAGGLSEGFIRSGYSPVAHVEMDEDACYTLKTRLAYHYLKQINKLDIYNNYLVGKINREALYKEIPDKILKSVLTYKITNGNVNKVFSEIISILKELRQKKIDIIIGGSPCQAYSLAVRSINKKRLEKDPRNYLYRLYARFLKKFRPKLFVFENVPGLLTANKGKYYKNLKNYFKRIGYNLDGKIINASEMGVIQKRKRVIIIGREENLKFEYPEFDIGENIWTVKDILYDLPLLKAGEAYPCSEYRAPINEYLQKSEIRNGYKFVTQNITRPHNYKDLNIYKMAINLWEKQSRRLKNSDIPKKQRTQKNTSSFLDRFKVVAGDRLSHTMIAHIAKDGHHYIHPDKKQLRSLSLREAARIQSFPDDYYFEGSRTSAFRQVGNAVPPLMAKTIANKIKNCSVKR